MAGNSKDSRILAYKDTISQLNITLSAQVELIKSLQQSIEAERVQNANLLEQIEYLTKKLFGTSSEKLEIAGQINLFDEAEQLAVVDPESEIPVVTIAEHTRKAKNSHAELFKGAPSRDEIISLSEDEMVCPACGAELEFL